MDPRNLDDDALTRLLSMTTELLIYSRLAGRLVTSSWPTRNGIKIRDKGLTSYLHGCGLFMECFCAFQSDSLHPKSCQIVVSNVTQDVLDAALKVSNFTEIQKKSLLTSSYPGLPTLASGNAPDMETLSSTLDTPLYEGTKRHSAPFTRLQKDIPPSNPRYIEIDEIYPSQTHRRQSAPVARPSRIAMDPVSQLSSPSSRGDAMEEKEAKNLRRLIDGQGVSEEVWDEIVERCAKCRLVFTSTALEKNAQRCLGRLTIL
ncbi:hypothetical protein B0H17DRAFT_1215380 [Mycena rosella]|uniref:Uncharacterized protein n=1 Tax=Mycena rosella TaxID=1033263 RepID=A0AAD7G1K8_MYCRO|nr:hypothetical protein B0H17DRAFT_1215380 [Mycena rosella]